MRGARSGSRPPADGIRLTIVTTRPADAVLYVLGVETPPPWCRVVSEPGEAARLADGTRCIGIFYEPRKRRSALEWTWIDRRRKGGILGLSVDEIEGIANWRARFVADEEHHLMPPAPETAGMAILQRRTQ